MSGSAVARLTQERKNWRKDHPFGFVARPENKADGHYPLTLKFSEEYPSKPPGCYFPAGFFHPNVYDSGRVCLSIINEEGSWKPSISIKQILEGIQALLTEPNLADPAQHKAYEIYKGQKAKYIETVRKQARKYYSENVV